MELFNDSKRVLLHVAISRLTALTTMKHTLPSLDLRHFDYSCHWLLDSILSSSTSTSRLPTFTATLTMTFTCVNRPIAPLQGKKGKSANFSNLCMARSRQDAFGTKF